MKPRIVIAGLLFAAAILTFTALAYQTVPVSTTQTITQESTNIGVSYSAYSMTTTEAYITQVLSMSIHYQPAITVCAGYYPPTCIGYPPTTITTNIPLIQTVQVTIETQETTAIPYSQTVTSSITEISNSIVPAYRAIGLDPLPFIVTAIIVIAILAATIRIAKK